MFSNINTSLNFLHFIVGALDKDLNQTASLKLSFVYLKSNNETNFFLRVILKFCITNKLFHEIFNMTMTWLKLRLTIECI